MQLHGISLTSYNYLKEKVEEEGRTEKADCKNKWTLKL